MCVHFAEREDLHASVFLGGFFSPAALPVYSFRGLEKIRNKCGKTGTVLFFETGLLMYHSKGSLLARLKTEKDPIPETDNTILNKHEHALLSQKTHASESVHAFVSHTCRVKLSQLGYELSVGRHDYLQQKLYFE